MQNFTRRGLFGGLALVASLGAVSTPAFADEIIITREPPPLRTEVIPVLPPARGPSSKCGSPAIGAGTAASTSGSRAIM